MKVFLAGYNLDRNTIEELKLFVRNVSTNLDPGFFFKQKLDAQEALLSQLNKRAIELIKRDNFTPETLSAAYARISRNPKPVNKLREIARQEVDRARKSNTNIIFGLGHSSVAEHATFNFDVIGVSRLAVETIEHFRLASYTEKSQRYILFKDDFITPKEIINTDFQNEYVQLIRKQNATYHKLYQVLKPYFFSKYSALSENKSNFKTLEGLAKEDARYVISLATQTQLGMTVNARTLENMISKCSAHPLSEIREYAKKLFESTKGIAPSIIKYTEPTEYLLNKDRDLSVLVHDLFRENLKSKISKETTVKLIQFPDKADDKILAAVLVHYGSFDFSSALQKIEQLSSVQKHLFFQKIFLNINSWEPVLREFEFIDFTFQLIVSAGSFGQLKRHRMANLISQDYDINLGVTVPESIEETGQKKVFLNLINTTNIFYQKLHRQIPHIAPYILTNSHRRRVLFKINLREFYHFSRMREDQHAQWDIRQIAQQMKNSVAGKLPLCGILLGGKDKFKENYNKIFMNETSS